MRDVARTTLRQLVGSLSPQVSAMMRLACHDPRASLSTSNWTAIWTSGTEQRLLQQDADEHACNVQSKNSRHSPEDYQPWYFRKAFGSLIIDFMHRRYHLHDPELLLRSYSHFEFKGMPDVPPRIGLGVLTEKALLSPNDSLGEDPFPRRDPSLPRLALRFSPAIARVHSGLALGEKLCAPPLPLLLRPLLSRPLAGDWLRGVDL